MGCKSGPKLGVVMPTYAVCYGDQSVNCHTRNHRLQRHSSLAHRHPSMTGRWCSDKRWYNVWGVGCYRMRQHLLALVHLGAIEDAVRWKACKTVLSRDMSACAARVAMPRFMPHET